MSRLVPPESPLAAYLDADLLALYRRDGDLPQLVRSDLAHELRGLLSAYAAFIPARLVQAQIADPRPGRIGGAFWQGSLLFADLSGFTAFSERLSILGKQGAEEVSAVVNRLFAAWLAEVETFQGTLLKFGGDALTVFFDAVTLGANHAAAAVSAALALQQRMADFTALETRAGTLRLRLRVGVHSGEVFAAEVGDASHVELVITGAEVNRVAQAQEIAAPGEVVISEQTAALIGAAVSEPRRAGFRLVRTAPAPALALPAAGAAVDQHADDIASLELLARQVQALQPYLPQRLPQRFLDPHAVDLGEFRPVSVVFANVADFSSVLADWRLHPALAAAVLNTYFSRAQSVVHSYDGIINKVDMAPSGDKLMALCGAPTAHEDDPLRAVYCALDMELALEEANAEIGALLADLQPVVAAAALNQRIGIGTGTVFAGRVGGERRYEYTVMGPAVNLAARLMNAAQAGTILISPVTRAAVARHIAVAEEAPLRFKGIAAPVVPARVLHAYEVEQAADSVALKPAPLVGHDENLDRLLAAAGAALRGAGRVLALFGEAGAGKSRLTEELIHQLVLGSVADAPAESIPPFGIYSGDCQSYEQRVAYNLFRAPLRHLLGIQARRNEAHSRRKRRGTRPLPTTIDYARIVAHVQKLAPDWSRFAPLLGDVLGIDLPETPLTLALGPESRHDRVQELVVALWLGAAAREPLLLALDKIHWADSLSLELLNRLAAAIERAPLLLVLNYRPELRDEPWTALPATVRLGLGELDQAASVALLGALLGGTPPAELLTLLERTQGNPLFIEELVRALVVAGDLVQVAPGRWQLARPPDQVAVPNSIEGLLIARLDKLDEPRGVLVQSAAVVGVRFAEAVVAGVYSHPTPLAESLAGLVEGQIIVPEPNYSEPGYAFRHALLRDVAYERILYARRRALHRAVARRIEILNRDRIDSYLAVLAWHYLQAEDRQAAFAYHLEAARQARRRYANRDALALFQTARDLAAALRDAGQPLDPGRLTAWPASEQALEPGVAWQRQRIEIATEIGEIYELLGEYENAEQEFRAALNELVAINADAWRAAVFVRLQRLIATTYERRSDYSAAFAWLEQGMARATVDTQREAVKCYLLGAGIYYRQGEFKRSLEWARMGLSLAGRVGSVADQAHALVLMSNLWRDQGEFATSIDALEEAHLLCQQLNDLALQCSVLNNLGLAYLQAGRWQDTLRSFEDSLAISESIGDVQAMARTANNLALVLVGRGALQRAGEMYQYSGEQFQRIGSLLGVAVTGYNRGEVLLLQGQPAAALALFNASIATFERINARNFLPEVLRLAAEATLQLGDAHQAVHYADYSLAVAAELGMAADSAIAQRVQAQIALQRGDLATAEQLLMASRAALAQLDNRYELGKVMVWQARLATISDDDTAATALLNAAAAIFQALDAQRDLAEVHTLLDHRSIADGEA